MAASSPPPCKAKALDWRLVNGLTPATASSSVSADDLMDQVDSAITAVEYVYANHYLKLYQDKKDKNPSKADRSAMLQLYDAQAADEAYRSGCAALARGDVEGATRFLEVALANCPPHKTRAISKVQFLLQQAAKPPNQSYGS